MAGLTSLKPSASYKSLLRVDDNTDGVDGTLEVVTDGEGTATPLKISSSAVIGTPLYTHFGIHEKDNSAFASATHYALPFMMMGLNNHAHFQLGSATSSTFNDTNPSSSKTLSTEASGHVTTLWYVIDDITVDAVHWLHAADHGTGDSTAAHLMAYTIDTDNGSTGGDLSSGVVVADGATITNAGNEQVYYQSMTIQSANVDAGKVICFTFAYASVTGTDYGVNATVKYHLR